ncbi:MAG: hypothetical protein ABII39_00920 [Candidatus Micrarchaeota archaeon]
MKAEISLPPKCSEFCLKVDPSDRAKFCRFLQRTSWVPETIERLGERARKPGATKINTVGLEAVTSHFVQLVPLEEECLRYIPPPPKVSVEEVPIASSNVSVDSSFWALKFRAHEDWWTSSGDEILKNGILGKKPIADIFLELRESIKKFFQGIGLGSNRDFAEEVRFRVVYLGLTTQYLELAKPSLVGKPEAVVGSRGSNNPDPVPPRSRNTKPKKNRS